jgi:hypothetical protein
MWKMTFTTDDRKPPQIQNWWTKQDLLAGHSRVTASELNVNKEINEVHNYRRPG